MMPADRRLKTRLDWSAITWSGVAAGATFMILEMLLVPILLGGSPWLPVRMVAAIVLGPDVIAAPDRFAPGVFLLGMALHFVFAIAYTALLARVVHPMSAATTTIAGVAFGFALYAVNYHLFSGVFPWFASARNLVTVFAHVAFGTLAAFGYHSMTTTRSESDRDLFDMRPRAPTI
jgi:hypothetical protein